MSKSRGTIKKQPMRDTNEDGVWGFENEWSRGLLDCCGNCKRCCFLLFCPCCFLCDIFKKSGECCCQGFIPGGLMALRTKIRTGFRIRGSMCGDFCVTTFCPFCALLQLDDELRQQEIFD